MKNIKEKFFEKLAELLKSDGFEYRKSNQDYVKKEGTKRFSFHISIIQHKNDFDVTADVAIRFDDIENLRNSENKMISEKEKKETYTIGVELGNLKGVGQHRWTFRNFEDIPKNVEDINEWFIEIAKPFFQRFKELDEVYRVFKNDIKEANLICPFSDQRKLILRIIENEIIL